MVMMFVVQGFAISAFRTGQIPCHAGNGCCACPCVFRDLTIGFSCLNQACDFEAFAPGLQLGQCSHIAQEPRNVCFRSAGCQCCAQSPEPGILAPAAFGEASLSHRRAYYIPFSFVSMFYRIVTIQREIIPPSPPPHPASSSFYCRSFPVFCSGDLKRQAGSS